MQPLKPIPLDTIRAAQKRNAGGALRTPLLPLAIEGISARIFLKLESLQPIGSFKLRGAGEAIAAADAEALKHGVITASAGNMAQGVAWAARRLGVPCQVVVPNTIPEHKARAIEKLGATLIPVPFAAWWRAIVEHRHPGLDGLFIHPVSNPAVLAGNGVIGLEIVEDLPEVDVVFVPFGGGGLGCGIACALGDLRPTAKVIPCEVETAAPLAAAWRSGEPVEASYTASFVEGVGGSSVLDEMWPLVRQKLSEPITVDLREVADAVHLLAKEARIIAEGAAATTLAAALKSHRSIHESLSEPRRPTNIVCVISGGQLGLDRLATILKGEIPEPRSL